MSDSEKDSYLVRLEVKLDRILNFVEAMDDRFEDHENRIKNLEGYVGHANLEGRKGPFGKAITFFSRDPLGSTASCVLAIVGVFYVIHNVFV